MDFDVVVERWVRRRSASDGDDPPFTLDADGFLPPPDDHEAEWLRPSEASSSGAWVLLGEPGSGKTTTFNAFSSEHDQAAPPLPGQPGTVWVTGSQLADISSAQEVVGVYLDALPASTDLAGEGADLVLVIDQLDESPFLRHFPNWLKKKLAARNTDRLRIWIACRTAEYRHELTQILEHALTSCVVGDLAPLTRPDATELVASTGADASAFLSTVVDNAAGVLASVPLTLRVLLSAYAQDPEVLQAGPKRLFDLGLAALADEHDDDRDPKLATTSREQRLAIARRVASHLVLSGRRTIHTGFVGDQSDQAVPVGAVIGDHESAGAGTFEVTKPRVTETLATALFSRTRQNTAMFAHSSFAAFLTARYLAARLTDPAPIPTPQLTGLFLVSAPDEDTAAIPEHLRETAAWLLAHAPAQARWLAAADPESLASHSAIITDPDIRALLVDGLLQRADRIELGHQHLPRGCALARGRTPRQAASGVPPVPVRRTRSPPGMAGHHPH
ncbi:NACHT domain-containing protein [Amycolatopsis sp. NPDC049868]|uniref:NACHT domain-containing protein n=1 Tax=Amycolatopsis sp. NPDC049868 TaxID=3363934 RepID=UPI00379BE80F